MERRTGGYEQGMAKNLARSLAQLFYARSFEPRARWQRGDRLVRADGWPIAVNELGEEAALTVFPEHSPDDAGLQATLVRLPPSLAPEASRVAAFSCICTYADGPVAMPVEIGGDGYLRVADDFS